MLPESRGSQIHFEEVFMENFLQVGVITSPHGVHGEAKVYPTTDDPRRFKKLKQVYLDRGRGMEVLHITGAKFFKQMVILKFAEFDTPEQINLLRKRELLVSREDAVPLEADEYFVADLVGMRVFTEDGQLFGEVADVMETGANDVYVVNSISHGQVLLPAVRDCIRRVDVKERRMEVHLLPGLLEL